MPLIELKNIKKYVLQDINLTVYDKEVLVLAGPNGSGKTTLLNIIAGLTKYSGNVLFDSRNINSLPAHKRGVGYLLQDLALFPHLNVWSNIAYGLKVQKYPQDKIAKRVDELLDALHIRKLKDKYPDNLSGGEKQRVAIARAIAPFQKVLLLDEPTSSLDAQTAKYFRIELKALLKRFEITSIIVMHDLLGAEEIADRIAILNKGRIDQVSTPQEILFHPNSEKVSEFIGMPNIIRCDRCKVLSTGLIEVATGDLTIILPYEGTKISKIAISPHDIYISDTEPPGPALNRFKGTITEIMPLRSLLRLKVNVKGIEFLTELSKEAFDEMELSVGKEVFVIIKLRRLRYAE
ncbi:MAG TPA: ABC transporter ATP-binding protein [Syntrophorhabdaceae bacterium]|nr:ABC transporter ATP-binding protein [Syntrophorhabdaceae bacterium]